MTQALGLIEVIGYPPAVEAADSALKAANVKLGNITKVGGGIVTVQIFGDVGAVKAAVDAGGIAAARVGKVRATHVIPRVAPDLSRVFIQEETPKAIKIQPASTKDLSSETSLSSIKSKGQQVSEVVSGYDTVSDLGPVVTETQVATETQVVTQAETKREPQMEVHEMEQEAEQEPQMALSTKSFEEVANDKQEEKPQEVGRLSPTELMKLSNKELKNIIASLGIKVTPKKLKSAKKDELINVIIQHKEGEN